MFSGKDFISKSSFSSFKWVVFNCYISYFCFRIPASSCCSKALEAVPRSSIQIVLQYDSWQVFVASLKVSVVVLLRNLQYHVASGILSRQFSNMLFCASLHCFNITAGLTLQRFCRSPYLCVLLLERGRSACDCVHSRLQCINWTTLCSDRITAYVMKRNYLFILNSMVQ